jgi:hypothetical protein
VSERQPFVAVVCSVPMLCEALSSALENIADVQAFPARRGDTVGLLRSVRPDVVVVDDPDEAESALPWAKRHGVPLLHVVLRERKIRVLRNGGWEESPARSAESLRNAVAGSIYARERGG